jgi:hypothetical protein
LGPNPPMIIGPEQGLVNVQYDYTFVSEDPED